jgi:hypothetical protein
MTLRRVRKLAAAQGWTGEPIFQHVGSSSVESIVVRGAIMNKTVQYHTRDVLSSLGGTIARTVSYDQLRVSVFDTVAALAAAAADDLAGGCAAGRRMRLRLVDLGYGNRLDCAVGKHAAFGVHYFEWRY